MNRLIETGAELTKLRAKTCRKSFLRCNGGCSSNKMISMNVARLMKLAAMLPPKHSHAGSH